MKKQWDEQEISILNQYYATSSRDTLLQFLPGRTWAGIRQYATKHLGLRQRMSDPNKKRWSVEEESQIKELILECTTQELADRFNVSFDQMSYKLNTMGLLNTKDNGGVWVANEKEILRQHYEHAPRDYILSLLPNRKWNAIQQQACKVLNLQRKANDFTYCQYNLFDEWNEKVAYLLGFIMADGYIQLKDHGGNSNTLQINANVRDIDIIYKIAAALKYRGNIYHKCRFRKDRDQTEYDVGIQINNKWMIQQIHNKGIPLQKKSYTATFPNDIPKVLIRHFIRGLIDGDGWISWGLRKANKNFYSILVGLCGTKNIIECSQQYLPSYIITSMRHVRSGTFAWNIEGEQAFNLCQWLYQDATIFLDRKYEAYCQAKIKYAPLSE